MDTNRGKHEEFQNNDSEEQQNNNEASRGGRGGSSNADSESPTRAAGDQQHHHHHRRRHPDPGVNEGGGGSKGGGETRQWNSKSWNNVKKTHSNHCSNSKKGSSSRRNGGDASNKNKDNNNAQSNSRHTNSNNSNEAAESPQRHHHRRHHRSKSSSHNNNDDYDDDDNSDTNEDPVLASLLEHLREFLADGMNAEKAIDVQKARNVLEACAGNMPLAAQLYWDDYFATQVQNDVRGSNSNHNSSESNPEDGEDDAPSIGPGSVGGASSGRKSEGKKQEQNNNLHESRGTRRSNENSGNEEDRRVRRRLDNDFERMQDGPVEEQPEHQDPAADVHVVFVAAQAVAAYAAQRERQNNNVEAIEDRGDPDVGGADGAAAENATAQSVSVSDDDSGANVAGLKRTGAGRIPAQMDDEDNSPHNSCGGGGTSHSQDRSKKRSISGENKSGEYNNNAEADDNGNEQYNDDIEKDGYLSDNDWVWASSLMTLRPPIDLLWGSGGSNSTTNSNAGAAEPEAEGNVIADDEADEENATSRTGIPCTWLNSGFAPDSSGIGLVVKTPKEEDIALYAWRERNSDSRESSIPRPYHCKAITGVLSVVTALLHTGALIQSNDISCYSSKKPYSDLTDAERKREFESRLADALSSLLFIAVKASVERKKKAIAARKAGSGSWDRTKEETQKLERKLGLCPTCWWEEDASTGEARLPEGRDAGHNLQISHSLTNIKDLRAYVLSNMRSFTSPGGCALFLETIFSIHGKGAIASMVRRARRRARLPNAADYSLISCTCEERQRKLLKDNPPPPRARNTIMTLDTTPPGHICLTTELLSLLLTGHVHSKFHGWSTGALGFGILSHKPGEVCKALSKPDKPVWILRGETCYSVLWLDGSSRVDREAETFSKQDHPGYVANLTHWNCWYGQRNKSGLRIICNSREWTAPSPSKLSAAAASSGPKRVVDSLRERRRQRALEMLKSMKNGQGGVDEETENQTVVKDDEVARVKMHPDDMVFYPKKYRLWRFDMGEDPEEQQSVDKKRRGQHWTPYHCLKKRQKLVVEMKLGPKINSILWTRWPEATIDKFTPEGAPPPIV